LTRSEEPATLAVVGKQHTRQRQQSGVQRETTATTIYLAVPRGVDDNLLVDYRLLSIHLYRQRFVRHIDVRQAPFLRNDATPDAYLQIQRTWVRIISYREFGLSGSASPIR